MNAEELQEIKDKANYHLGIIKTQLSYLRYALEPMDTTTRARFQQDIDFLTFQSNNLTNTLSRFELPEEEEVKENV